MAHLSVDEIIRFVSLTELDCDAIKLAADVNGHIRSCEKCRKLVRAFQVIYDEFTRLDIRGDFRKFLANSKLNMLDDEIENETESALSDIERYK